MPDDDGDRLRLVARRTLNVLLAVGLVIFVLFVVGGILLLTHG